MTRGVPFHDVVAGSVAGTVKVGDKVALHPPAGIEAEALDLTPRGAAAERSDPPATIRNLLSVRGMMFKQPMIVTMPSPQGHLLANHTVLMRRAGGMS
jgi:hypothetical protein